MARSAGAPTRARTRPTPRRTKPRPNAPTNTGAQMRGLPQPGSHEPHPPPRTGRDHPWPGCTAHPGNLPRQPHEDKPDEVAEIKRLIGKADTDDQQRPQKRPGGQ